MALIAKLGNILKYSASRQNNFDLAACSPSMYQAIRCMSSKIFIGGLSYGTDDLSLKEVFGQYGEIIEAKVMINRETGRSRGFAFVTFTSKDDASNAIKGMDGQDVHGRRISVKYAIDKPRGFKDAAFRGNSEYANERMYDDASSSVYGYGH